jgi:hypothetical protein
MVKIMEYTQTKVLYPSLEPTRPTKNLGMKGLAQYQMMTVSHTRMKDKTSPTPSGCAILAERGASFGSDRLDQAEVRDLHVAAVADQDVLWLEVAVDDGGLELMQALRTRENAATG